MLITTSGAPIGGDVIVAFCTYSISGRSHEKPGPMLNIFFYDSKTELGFYPETQIRGLTMTQCVARYWSNMADGFCARGDGGSKRRRSVNCPLAVNASLVALFHDCYFKTTRVLILTTPETMLSCSAIDGAFPWEIQLPLHSVHRRSAPFPQLVMGGRKVRTWWNCFLEHIKGMHILRSYSQWAKSQSFDIAPWAQTQNVS